MPRRAGPDQLLVTILVTDMVGSTELAAEVGDQKWRELLRSHHSVVRRELKRFGGREIDNAGDGFLAIFESPGSAIGAASAIVRDVVPLGLRVRTGLHMGECLIVDGKVEGITVHIGARVAGMAQGGEVLVSSTVRDALVGSRLAFEDRGTHQLKGVPGQWRIFAVEHPEDATKEPTGPYAGRFPGSRPRRSRRAVVAGGSVALAAVAAIVLFFLWPSGTTVLTAIPANSVGRIDPGDGTIVAAIPSEGDQPVSLAYLDGSVWVANALSRTVTRVDTDTEKVVKLLATKDAPVGLAAGFGAIWVLESSGLVERIDSASDQIIGTVQVASNSHAIAVGPGAIWVANSANGTVTQINPSTMQKVNTVPVGQGGTGESPGALAAAGSSVWVTDELGPNLWRIDTQTQRQAGGVSLQDKPSGIAIAPDGSVWVSMASADTVARVDPSTGQSVTVDVGPGPTALTVGENAVWVVDTRGNQITEIDLTSRKVVGTIDVGAVPSAVVIGSGSVWVAAAPS